MSSKTTRKSVAATSASQATASSSVSSPQVTTSSGGERMSTPLSPTRLTRIQEKLELQNLNDRLAAYIERVRYLEVENSRLSVQIQTSEETKTREVTSVKSVYEQELAETRKLLDETARDKARMQIENDKWKTELDDTQKRLQKREKDFTSAEKKLISTEAKNEDLQARLNQHVSENKRLSDALKESEADRDKLAKQLGTTKSQLEEEAVYRVDLLNKIQSVKEEMTFRETMHQTELSESQISKRTEISDLDLNLKDEYEQKLADTLRDIRDQYESQIRMNREQIEAIYESKLFDLQNLCDKYSSTVNNSKDQLRNYKVKIDTLTTNIKELENQTESLRNRIKDLEGLLEQEREWNRLALQAKDEEISALQADAQKQLREYQDLLDIKVYLDLEIAAYRKLLEGEESRLKITPSKLLSGEVQRSTPVRRTPLRGKRKRTLASTEKSSSDYQSSASAKGDVEIHEHDPNGKFVKLFNKGKTDIPLGGWQLIRRAGEQETMYKFHRSLLIKSNSYVTVWSSDSSVTHNPPTDNVMKGLKWVTADAMTTTLLSNNGEEVAVRETSKRIHRASEQRTFTTHFSEELYHQRGDPESSQERCTIM